MDRTKYGRKLTFLNAYFSAAIVILAYCIVILVFLLAGRFSPVWLLLFGMPALMQSVWHSCHQIIELRAGLPVEDRRTVYPTSGHRAFREARFLGLGITGLVLFFFLVLRQEPNPVSDSPSGKFFAETLLSLGGVLGALWVERAVWEWRALWGEAQASEWVERISDDAVRLPETESGLKRYIRESGWLCQFGAWLLGGTLFLPSLILLRESLFTAALPGALSLSVLILLVPIWSRVRKNRAACQKKLEENASVVTSIAVARVEEPAPVYQSLRQWP